VVVVVVVDCVERVHVVPDVDVVVLCAAATNILVVGSDTN